MSNIRPQSLETLYLVLLMSGLSNFPCLSFDASNNPSCPSAALKVLSQTGFSCAFLQLHVSQYTWFLHVPAFQPLFYSEPLPLLRLSFSQASSKHSMHHCGPSLWAFFKLTLARPALIPLPIPSSLHLFLFQTLLSWSSVTLTFATLTLDFPPLELSWPTWIVHQFSACRTKP